MRISINLATRRFVELRPLFARLRLAMAGLGLLAIGLGVWLHSLNHRAHLAQAQMAVLQTQTAVLEHERVTNENRMAEPLNHAVLERSRFLNDLFATKSFSWTSVMMDLERVLPAGVQVTSIEPVITANHEVSIHMRVNGDRDRAVELVRNLERSQRFVNARLANETAQTQEHGAMSQVAQAVVPGGVEFEILSGYNPLPAVDKETLAKAKVAQDTSAAKGVKTPAKPVKLRATAPVHKSAVTAPASTSAKLPAKRGVQ